MVVRIRAQAAAGIDVSQHAAAAPRLHHDPPRAVPRHRLRTAAPEMDEPHPAEATTMKCRITECSGTDETKRRVRTIHRKGELLVIRHIPTEVCDICGDTFFDEETVRHLEAMAHDPGTPVGRVPLYEYA
jgi:YgiT-type zinc finger domain-containing protein